MKLQRRIDGRPRRTHGFCLGLGCGLICLMFGSTVFAEEAAPEITTHANSPRVGLNTVGYLPGAPKRATIRQAGEGEFVIRDTATGREAFRSRTSPMQPDPRHGEYQIADFSALRRSGRYEIAMADGGDALEFTIDDGVYNWPFYCAARAMYLSRCGTAVEGHFAGHTFSHAACHLEDGHLDHAGAGASGRLDGTGGWHDAGDYNKYTVNAAFTVGMMMHAWEHFGDHLAPLDLDIPESTNDTPDFLDEVRWELEWLLKMQADDGRVYHKLSALKFNAFELPDEETAPRYFSPWGSAATADFAAVMAQAARVFRPYDETFAQRCLEAAEKSYDFLITHPDDHRPDQSAFATGEYGTGDRDDRLWAAAELWETTGREKYVKDFEQRTRGFAAGEGAPPLVDSDWDWSNVRNLGTFTYLLSSREGRDAALVARIREDALRSADAIAGVARREVDGRPLGVRYYWGCNGTVARLAMNLHVAHRLTGESQFRETMLDALNYLFGRNPYGRSFITGLGHRPPMYPHDRRSGGDEVVPPWPGYLVGGPWPTAGDWQDEEEDYRTNEIAINWNGALIYALAAFVEPGSFDASIEAAERLLSPAAAER